MTDYLFYKDIFIAQTKNFVAFF